MAVALGLEIIKPPNLDIIPTSANFTIYTRTGEGVRAGYQGE